MACVYVYVIILAIIGPEYKGRHMGIAHDEDLEEAVGHETVEQVVHEPIHDRASDRDHHITKV
jgi:SHS family lactate transporter-like MFS transporter